MSRKLTLTLLFLILLLPVGIIVSASFGYHFSLISIDGHSVLTALVAVCTVVQLRKSKDTPDRLIGFILAIILPLALINGLVLVGHGGICVILSSIITTICCLFLSAEFGVNSIWKLISLILSSLMILPIIFLGFLLTLFADFGRNTLVYTVESPGGSYCAHVIDSNQGALGGATLVDVYEKKGINLLFLTVTKEPERIYYGDWNTYHDMQIRWMDDTHLIINGAEYLIE